MEGPSTHYNALLAAAPMIGVDCLKVNKAFAKCKLADDQPGKCGAEGQKVTGCVLKVLRYAEDNCSESFIAYQKALTKFSRHLPYCEKEQKVFEAFKYIETVES